MAHGLGTAHHTAEKKLGNGRRIERGFTHTPVRKIGTNARFTELGATLKYLVAGNALAITPTTSLVGTEIGPTDLLGVAGHTAQIRIDELASDRDAGRARRKG